MVIAFFTAFQNVESMIKISITTQNIYLERALKEIITEIANAKGIQNIDFQKSTHKDRFKNTDVLFTEMEVGEYLLCQKMRKLKSERPIIIIFTAEEVTLDTSLLPFCIQNCVFLSNKSSLAKIKKSLSVSLDEFITGKKKYLTTENHRCLKCPHQSLSRSQQKIVNAINIGLNNNETAQKLGIDHRTVYSHKVRIMKKFRLETNQELIRFCSMVMKKENFQL